MRDNSVYSITTEMIEKYQRTSDMIIPSSNCEQNVAPLVQDSQRFELGSFNEAHRTSRTLPLLVAELR